MSQSDTPKPYKTNLVVAAKPDTPHDFSMEVSGGPAISCHEDDRYAVAWMPTASDSGRQGSALSLVSEKGSSKETLNYVAYNDGNYKFGSRLAISVNSTGEVSIQVVSPDHESVRFLTIAELDSLLASHPIDVKVTDPSVNA